MNTLFLTAIIGEMCMDYNVNLKNGRYSPFKLFKQQMEKSGAPVKGGRKPICILHAINLQQTNGLAVHPLAVKAIAKMLDEKTIDTIYSNVENKSLTTILK